MVTVLLLKEVWTLWGHHETCPAELFSMWSCGLWTNSWRIV